MKTDFPSQPLKTDLPLSLLSHGQEALWLLQQQNVASTDYHLAISLRLSGNVDLPSLASAWDDVIRSHPQLRTRVLLSDHRLGFVTNPDPEPLQLVAADAWVSQTQRAFDLSEEPPVRARFTQETGSGVLDLCLHHIAGDLVSSAVILDDLARAYQIRREGRFPETPEVGLPFGEFVSGERLYLDGVKGRADRAFWKHELAGLGTPLFGPSPARAGGELPLALSREVSLRLRMTAESAGVTPFTILLGLYAELLAEARDVPKVTIGVAASLRDRQGFRRTVGYLVNSVPLCYSFGDAGSGHLQALSATTRAALTHRRFPLPLMAEDFRGPRQHGVNPLFQAIFAYQSLPRPLRHLLPVALSLPGAAWEFAPGIQAERLATPPPDSQFPIDLALGWVDDCFRGRLRHDGSAEAKAAASHIAAGLSEAAERNIPANHRTAVKVAGLSPIASSHTTERLHSGFERNVAVHPEALALLDGGTRLSYAELDARANAAASLLQERDFPPEGLVAVILPKGWAHVVACLAVLKAGGVYVPLDPALPTARLEAIFGRGGFEAAWIENTAEPRSFSGLDHTRLLTLPQPAAGKPFSPRPIHSENPAYVFFTSGTTGVSKGVMLSHRAALSTIHDLQARFNLGPADAVLSISSTQFDLSIFDVFALLGTGGTVVFPSGADPSHWLKDLTASAVTVWNSVPCLFELLLDEAANRPEALAQLRLVMLSGDFVPAGLARRIRETLPHARLFALGGATEDAIWTVFREVDVVKADWVSVPYGQPMIGRGLAVLDENLEPCPVGVEGEICLIGNGLATGYWKDPAQTAIKFPTHPRLGFRFFRTADRGRLRPDGDTDILGRLDSLVKLNGVRVEVEEIELALRAHPQVRRAWVEVRKDAAGGASLAAVVQAPGAVTPETLAFHAASLLPAALLPSAYLILEHPPLTANGKLDRSALRNLVTSTARAEREVPATTAERRVAAIWADMLGQDDISLDDDFFALGGHSLMGVRMLQQIRARLGVSLPLSLLGGGITLRQLAVAVAMTPENRPTAILERRPVADLESWTEPELTSVSPSRAGGDILLTGATGLLGQALLRELLAHGSERIVCLIRASSAEVADRRLRGQLGENFDRFANRIEALPCDLNHPELGLNETHRERLEQRIGAIYHCAAEVNFTPSFERLVPAHVGATRRLVQLAARAGAVFHHVSSVAVFPYGGSEARREDENLTEVGTLAGGYAQAKWAAERLVWKASAQGLRTVVYRPGQIVGRGTGFTCDLFGHVWRCCRMLGAVPDLGLSLNFITADYAARILHRLSRQTTSIGGAFHLVHPHPIPLQQFARSLPSQPMLISWEKWKNLLREATETRVDDSLAFVLHLTGELSEAEVIPPAIDRRRTTLALGTADEGYGTWEERLCFFANTEEVGV